MAEHQPSKLNMWVRFPSPAYSGVCCLLYHMVGVAQLVSAPDCGSGGRGFESLHPPLAGLWQNPVRVLFFIYSGSEDVLCGWNCLYLPEVLLDSVSVLWGSFFIIFYWAIAKRQGTGLWLLHSLVQIQLAQLSEGLNPLMHYSLI